MTTTSIIVVSMDSIELLVRAFGAALIFGVLPLAAIALLCGLATLPFAWNKKEVAVISFLFGLVGASLGLLLGNSREPAVAAYLPAIITLLGGLVIYAIPKQQHFLSLFSKSESESQDPAFIRVFVIAAVMSLVTASVAATNVGATLRMASVEAERDFERKYEEWKKFHETVQLPLEKRQLERALGFESAD
ncbi:hypothetical protein [Cribrihabitans pelagius]|uniref:hypothetical protein n=1 Tax=Cribrihabitans pelagius TaxID=1765746 RepID=UPI003B5A9BB1